MSQRVWKDGLRPSKCGDVQRYLCRDCGRRFSGAEQKGVVKFEIEKNVILQPLEKLEPRPDLAQIPICHFDSTTKKPLNDPPLPGRKDVTSHFQSSETIAGKNINDFASTIVNAKYAFGKKAKNLVRVEARQKRVAGATTLSEADIKGKQVEFIWHMKKQGYAESTIRSRGGLLRRLMNLGADLYDCESVKKAIAEQSWCDGRKSNACDTYTTFLDMLGKTWERPRYRSVQKRTETTLHTSRT